MKEFRQQKLFVKKTFKFKEDGIEFMTKDLDGEFSKFVHFNDIEPRKKSRLYTEKFPRLLQSGLVITAIALIRGLMTSADDSKKAIVVSLIGVAFGALTIIAFFIIRIKYYLIELEDETQMFIILNKPNEKEMEGFVDEVFSRRKAYYREQYFYINYENTKEKELGRMNWLKTENIISDNEYNVVVDEINAHLN